MRGLFISGTGTGVGKTFITRGLTAALRSQGHVVKAFKPIETGVDDARTTDAAALARASGFAEHAELSGFYRAKAALSPYAATLEGEKAPPPISALVDVIHQAARGAELVLIEGAGGIQVPLDARNTMADLAAALGLPLLLVAPNALGVLSNALCAATAARAKRLELRGLVLVDPADREADPSVRTNARILDERLGVPVYELPRCEDRDDALAVAVTMSGLTATVLDAR